MTRSLSARRRIIAVLCGGFFGTITRFALSTIMQGWLGKGWPYDLLLINVTGALLLAFVTTLADATFLVGPTRRLFINVGFLGAYTTFSSLALGDVLLLAHELRNEFVEELSPDLMSESRAERDAPLVRGGRNRGMESEKGRR